MKPLISKENSKSVCFIVIPPNTGLKPQICLATAKLNETTSHNPCSITSSCFETMGGRERPFL